MKISQIAILVFLLFCFSLTACGRKTKVVPEEGVEVTYPRSYPKAEA